VSSVATTKNLKTAAPAAPRAKTPSPKEKLKVKTPATIKADDWYETAFKRFSISQRFRAKTANQHLGLGCEFRFNPAGDSDLIPAT